MPCNKREDDHRTEMKRRSNNYENPYTLSTHTVLQVPTGYPLPPANGVQRTKTDHIDVSFLKTDDAVASLFATYHQILTTLENDLAKSDKTLLEIFSHGIMALDFTSIMEHPEINTAITTNNLVNLSGSLPKSSSNCDQDKFFHRFKFAYENLENDPFVGKRLNELISLLSFVELHSATLLQETNHQVIDGILFLLGEHFARLLERNDINPAMDQDHIDLIDLIDLIYKIRDFRNGIKHGDTNVRFDGKHIFVIGKNDPDIRDKLFSKILAWVKEIISNLPHIFIGK
jgi:hypothetical protein